MPEGKNVINFDAIFDLLFSRTIVDNNLQKYLITPMITTIIHTSRSQMHMRVANLTPFCIKR